MPSDWSAGHFKRMFLPELAGESFVIEFDEIDVISREELRAGERFAILSNRGVNLRVQRWLFHNSHVVVPTITINAQASGPFEEADLIQEPSDALVVRGAIVDQAHALIDSWLGESAGEGSRSRRDLLSDPQQRSVVRSSLRRKAKDWIG